MDYEEALEYLDVNDVEIKREFIEQPAKMAFLVNQFVDAKRRYMRVKLGFEQTKARIRLEVKERLTDQAKQEFKYEHAAQESAAQRAKKAGFSYKKAEVRLRLPTEADIESHTLADEDYIEARLAFIEAECDLEKNKGWADVSRARRDMLTALGLRLNAELRAIPTEVAGTRGSGFSHRKPEQ